MKDKQLTLMDAILTMSRRKKTSRAVGTLDSIAKLVDWEALVKIVEGLDRTREGRGGRPPIPFEVKLKMLFLQYTFNLSDEELEDQLIDRLSFQQFVGLGYDEEIPDFTTFWKFKEKLAKGGTDTEDLRGDREADRGAGADPEKGNYHRRDFDQQREPSAVGEEPREEQGERPDRHGRVGGEEGQKELLRLQGSYRDGRRQQDHPQMRSDSGRRS